VETCSHNPSSVNGRAARWTFAATLATTPFAVEAGSQLAAAWNTPLLSPPELRRIAHDLGAKKRIRIEGPNVPHSVAVLVPLCHCETTGEPHVLFTVANDDFGAPHVFFPRAPIARTVRPRDAHSVGDAIKLAFRTLGLEDDLGGGADSGAEKVSTKTLPSLYARLEILGLTSDCPDIATQTAVTPVVGYLGTIDVPGLRAKSLAKSLIEKTPTLMAMSLDHLLSRQSIDARVVPGIGPMPVFNATTSKDSPLQIWGLTAQILHGVLRVVVGPRSEYAEALYGPFARRAREVAWFYFLTEKVFFCCIAVVLLHCFFIDRIADSSQDFFFYLFLYAHAFRGGQSTLFFWTEPLAFTRRKVKNILFVSSTAPCSLNPHLCAAATKESMDATPLLPSNLDFTSAIQHTPPTFKTCFGIFLVGDVSTRHDASTLGDPVYLRGIISSSSS
jgi:hypothetical protein